MQAGMRGMRGFAAARRNVLASIYQVSVST
jgi:hypothetical protein